VHLDRLWLTDFRSYASAEIDFVAGLTALVGSNGQGKTNVLEAIGYLATLSSFRGAPNEAMVAQGAGRAVVRGQANRDGRDLLLEVEIAPGGRSRAQVNRQPLRRSRDLLGALRVSVFSPDDLALVKGGPGGRRRWLDDVLVALHPRNDALTGDVDRVLRQRNALLKQAGGRLTSETELTLDVWDAKLAQAGEALAAARADLVSSLAPVLAASYADLAGEAAPVRATYDPPWRTAGLAAALVAGRRDDLRRGISLIGPHRDELDLALGAMPARTHASQGEQRSLALALRLAAHRLVADATGGPPVLLLDDVFSELDSTRGDALLAHLPPGQTVLATAGALPNGTRPERTFRIEAGSVHPED
jgi:DNA replication and repair protein RecF